MAAATSAGVLISALRSLPPASIRQMRTAGSSARRAASTQPAVPALIAEERAAGMEEASYYAAFAQRMAATRMDLLDLLIRLRRALPDTR